MRFAPHTEDEIYVVTTGRATVVSASGTAAVGPGSAIYVPAGLAHGIGEGILLVFGLIMTFKAYTRDRA